MRDLNENTRTFEDADDEEAARIVANMTSSGQMLEEGQSSLRQLVQQPYSEAQPVLRSSALINSAIRADTPIDNTSEIRKNEQSSSRAFSKSSNRRGRNNDVEGARVPTKTIDCQTDTSDLDKPKKVEVEQADQDTQTVRRDFAPVQLSPFDTYDLFFVKDLVNNLNQDNEVLVDSN